MAMTREIQSTTWNGHSSRTQNSTWNRYSQCVVAVLQDRAIALRHRNHATVGVVYIADLGVRGTYPKTRSAEQRIQEC